MRIRELEGKFDWERHTKRLVKKELNWGQHAKRLAEELFDTQKLQIKIEAVQHFWDSVEYLDKLTKYNATTDVKFLNDMAKLMIKRGVKIAIPASSAQII